MNISIPEMLKHRKPMFYTDSLKGLVTGNNPVDVARRAGKNVSINTEAVDAFLQYGYVPRPLSIVNDVWRFIDEKHMTAEQEVDFGTPDESLTPSAVAKELRSKLSEAVERATANKQRIAVSLSGGVDSAIVATLVAEMLDKRKCKEPIDVFVVSVGSTGYDEYEAAKQTAQWLDKKYKNVQMHRLPYEPENFKNTMAVLNECEQPFADGSLIVCKLLANQMAKTDVDILLGGDGADELFGGYERYVATDIKQRHKNMLRPFAWLIPKVFARGEHRTSRDRIARFASFVLDRSAVAPLKLISSTLPDGLIEHKYDVRFSKCIPENRCAAERLALSDIVGYLFDDIFVKLDNAFEENVPCRSPFLDDEVVDLALRMPWDFKQRGFKRKIALRMAFKNMLPPGIFSRKKRGFGIPVAKYLRTVWKDDARVALSSDCLKQAGINIEMAQSTFQEFVDGDDAYADIVWRLVVLDSWMKSWL